MNFFETCLLLVTIPLALIGAGYWLADGLPSGFAAERLALAMLAGLAVVLWTVSVVNLALPLAGIWGWVCLLPVLLSVARANRRRALARDLGEVVLNRRGAAFALLTSVFLGFLLWPLLSRPDVVFYDGTGNHDAFFWVTGAEHLKRQNYLQTPLADAVSPLYYSVTSITGWRPVWGRMGAEGLLALASNIAGASPLKLYVAATAALFLPWVAAVYLVARTFVLERISFVAAATLFALQPMFVFFHSNANLPNLIGVLCGALVVVGVARALAEPSHRGPWLGMIVLGGHGLLVSYPEMTPAIALPCLLLVARAWWKSERPVRHRETDIFSVLWASLGALAINPATAVRAWNGFWNSLEAVHSPESWPNMFADVPAAAAPIAMLTLSVRFGRDLGPMLGAVCCGILFFATLVTIWRAKDRFGSAALLSGAVVLLIYTLLTNFDYGWQKAVQFVAVFATAILPVGAIGVIRMDRSRENVRHWPAWIGAAVAVIFISATIANGRESHKWAARKSLTRDWFAARDFTRKTLRNAPVLIDTSTFSQPFFYTMWATYFLTDSRVYFPDADASSGGYLGEAVRKDAITPRPQPRAILVSSGWAERFNLPRGWTSDTLALVPATAGARPQPQ